MFPRVAFIYMFDCILVYFPPSAIVDINRICLGIWLSTSERIFVYLLNVPD
jgi:hypothetical protein